jgi:hypothetical protein
MTLTVYREQASGTVQFCVIANGREEVQNLSVISCRVTNAIRRDYRQLQ